MKNKKNKKGNDNLSVKLELIVALLFTILLGIAIVNTVTPLKNFHPAIDTVLIVVCISVIIFALTLMGIKIAVKTILYKPEEGLLSSLTEEEEALLERARDYESKIID